MQRVQKCVHADGRSAREIPLTHHELAKSFQKLDEHGRGVALGVLWENADPKIRATVSGLVRSMFE